MLKIILTGAWVCVVALGSVYFSIRNTFEPVAPDLEVVPVQYIPGEMVTIPVIRQGALQGYFLARVSFSVARKGITSLRAPFRQMATDGLYDLLVGSKFIDVGAAGTFDLPSFKKVIKDGLNSRLGEDLITEVLVEQLEYLTMDDVKRVANNQNVPRQKPVPIVDKNGNVASDKLPEGAVKDSDAH